MHKRPTTIGFFVFAGLVIGAVIGNWLPYMATLEAVAGGVIGAVIGFMVDKKIQDNSETNL
jgi:uncharacterized membrane protein